MAKTQAFGTKVNDTFLVDPSTLVVNQEDNHSRSGVYRHHDLLDLIEGPDAMQIRGNRSPVLVKKIGDQYKLVAGYRRWTAAMWLIQNGHPGFKLRAEIRQYETAREEAIDLFGENATRRELSPMDIAKFCRYATNVLGMTHTEVAELMPLSHTGKKRGADEVSQFLALLDLSPTVQKTIAVGLCSWRSARVLVGVDEETTEKFVAKLQKEFEVDEGHGEGSFQQAIDLALSDPANPIKKRSKKGTLKAASHTVTAAIARDAATERGLPTKRVTRKVSELRVAFEGLAMGTGEEQYVRRLGAVLACYLEGRIGDSALEKFINDLSKLVEGIEAPPETNNEINKWWKEKMGASARHGLPMPAGNEEEVEEPAEVA